MDSKEKILSAIKQGILKEVKVLGNEELQNENIAFYITDIKTDGSQRCVYVYDKSLVGSDNEEDIVKYIIKNGHGLIWKSLPHKFQTEEMLKFVIRNWKNECNVWKNQPAVLFLDVAKELVTNEIIDLLFENDLLPFLDSNYSHIPFYRVPGLYFKDFWDDEYCIKKLLQEKPELFQYVSHNLSPRLKHDKQIQVLMLMSHPNFLKIVGSESIQQYLTNYGSAKNIIGYDVETALLDDEFIKSVLTDFPETYGLFPKTAQADKENMQRFLEIDGTNLLFIQHEYVTKDIISLAKNSYDELFKLLEDDRSGILDFLKKIDKEQKIFNYVLYIFVKDSNSLYKFINGLKNNEIAYNEMIRIIAKSKKIFFSFLKEISSNNYAREFFNDVLVTNPDLLFREVMPSDDFYFNLWDCSSCYNHHSVAIIRIDENGKKHEIVDRDFSDPYIRDIYKEETHKWKGIVQRQENVFHLGMNIAKEGELVINISGGRMQVYLPESMSLKQYESLNEILDLCERFKDINIAYIKDGRFWRVDSELGLLITKGMLKQFCERLIPKTSGLNQRINPWDMLKGPR